MILNEKFNPYIKAVRIFFSENWGTFFIFKEKRGETSAGYFRAWIAGIPNFQRAMPIRIRALDIENFMV